MSEKTAKELAEYLRSIAPDFSFGDRLSEAATALDRLHAYDTAGGDLTEIERRNLVPPLIDARTPDGEMLGKTLRIAELEKDGLTLLLALKKSRADREALKEGVMVYRELCRLGASLRAPHVKEWEEQHGHLVKGSGQ